MQQEFEYYNQDNYYLLTTDNLYSFNNIEGLELIINKPVNIVSKFTGFCKTDNILYFSLYNNGIIMLNGSEWLQYIPNTMLQNKYTAIDINDNISLVAIACF